MPKLHECDIERLHPTQITVGMIEVIEKRQHLSDLGHHHRKAFLEERPIPAVLGPNDKLYLTDHHHLGRALHEAGIGTGFFLVEADLSDLSPPEFWRIMEERQWVHPVDEFGTRHGIEAIPKHIRDLKDDPFRSLAGYVRKQGGFEKCDTAFTEFLWADFFRTRVVVGTTRAEFDAALEKALSFARSPEASHLPGYQAAKAGG